MRKKAAIVSLGCPKNLVDSEVMAASLLIAGYDLTADPAEADVAIVNTCGFIGDAKKESIDTIFDIIGLKAGGKRPRIVIAAGCLIKRYKDEIVGELSEVDGFIGVNEPDKIGTLVRAIEQQKGIRSPVAEISDTQYLMTELTPRLISTPAHMAYLKIAEGCSRTCSFCVIPSIRGTTVSRPIASIVREARKLALAGVVELNIIAQDITQYGIDTGTTLTALLEKLARIPKIKFIRLLYAYPNNIPRELVSFIKREPKIVRYLDMPIQHISDRILKDMRRAVSSKKIRTIIALLKKEIPEIRLRTSVIVGYPGETEADFAELEAFVGEGHFDYLGVFKYSEEDGSPIFGRIDKVPKRVVNERYRRLISIQSQVVKAKQAGMIGKSFPAFVESPEAVGKPSICRLTVQAPEIDGIVVVEGPKHPLGSVAQVTITRSLRGTLQGIFRP